MKRVKSIAIPCILATAIYTLPVHPQRATDDIIAPARFDILRKAGPLQLWYIAAETKTGDTRWQIPPGINTWNDWRRRAGHFGIHPWEGAGKFAPRNLKLSAATADSAQIGWIRHYASQLAPSWDEAYAVAIDGSGNVYVTGASTKLPYGLDCLTIKYNASGGKIWEARYNGPIDRDDYALDVALDPAGNVYVGGASTGAGTALDYLVIKYNSAGGEQWVARYDGPGHSNDSPRELAVDDSGNVYITGASAGTANADYATVKYNTNGVQQWVARYNGPQNLGDDATALALDRLGNVYVTGVSYFTDTGDDYTTVKYNSAGAQQWVARYSNNGESNSSDWAVAIAVDASGNTYVTGSSAAAVNAARDYATVKYNSAGLQRWVARYSGPADDSEFARDLAVDNSGNVYVTGDSWGEGAFVDYATIKYNTDGVQEWVDRYNGPAGNFDVPRAIVADAAGNVYVTGASRSYGGIWGDQDDFATIKYSPAGTKQWITRYSAPANGYDQATALAVDAAGNVYVTGRSEAANNDYDFATIKYSASGSQLWLNRESGPGSSRDYARAFTVDGAGNVYLTGYSEGAESIRDFATVKFNSDGVQQWAARYNGPGIFFDTAADIAVDVAGNVYVTGESDGVDTGRDYTTVKYNAAGEQQWVARYNTPGNLPDSPVALEVDRLGNVYVTGTAYYSSDGLNTDLTTIKYDANGNAQWIAVYNGPANLSEHAAGLAIDAIGNIYVVGASSLADASLDYLTIKYNSAGVRQWVAHYNGAVNSVDVAVAVAADKFGNVYVTGTSRNLATAQDIVTLKYRADDGKPLWIASRNGAGNSSDRPAALVVDKSGNIYVAGSSFEPGKASPYLTIKYNPQGMEQWAARYSGNVNEFYEATGLGVDDLGNVFVTGYSYSPDYVQTTVKYSAAGVEQWVSKRHGVSASGVALDFLGNPYVAGSTSGTYWSAYTITKYIQSAQSLSLPSGYSLAQNYPNPFKYATSIRYALPASGRVTLKVFNLVGQEVTTVIDAERAAGIHEVDWGDENLPSGVYVYRLQTNGFAQTKKFVLLK